jgi:hypothetical protein
MEIEMAASYSIGLERTLDWVRFLIGDRNTDAAVFQDEELLALISEEGNKYFTAAAALRQVQNRGGGVISKTVDDLSLTYSDSPDGALSRYIDTLMLKGHAEQARSSGSKNAYFRTT